MQTAKAILLILLNIALVTACGLRGPLYLPDESPTAEPATEQGSVADADDADKTDDDKKKKTDSG
jgi:predicted small lipoprotein YifL